MNRQLISFSENHCMMDGQIISFSNSYHCMIDGQLRIKDTSYVSDVHTRLF